MRNTLQYPVTLNEMIEACERAAAEFIEQIKEQGADAPVGDIHGLALQEAANRLKRLQFAAQDPMPKNLRTYNRKQPSKARNFDDELETEE